MTGSTYVPLPTPRLKFKYAPHNTAVEVDLLGLDLVGVDFVRVDLMGLTHSHTSSENIHVPATSIPQKKTSRRKPTINTSPMMVPTGMPAIAPGDKPGRVVVTGGECVTVGTISPGGKLGRTMVGGRAVARERNKSIPVSEMSCQLACGLEYTKLNLYINLHVGGIAVYGEHMGRGSGRSNFDVPKSLQMTPSPLTSSLTLLVSIPATLDTEQVYTPASLSARVLISSCDLKGLPVLLVIWNRDASEVAHQFKGVSLSVSCWCWQIGMANRRNIVV